MFRDKDTRSEGLAKAKRIPPSLPCRITSVTHPDTYRFSFICNYLFTFIVHLTVISCKSVCVCVCVNIGY